MFWVNCFIFYFAQALFFELQEVLKMEDSKKEKRVELPEDWNSCDKTWIKKDDFKDKNGGEINDIEQKINKFIELLNKVKVSDFKGGITNFCFRFPNIVESIFGHKCDPMVVKSGFFSKKTTKSTNPFDHENFCDAIFNFIDKNSEEEAKKQNYCLLFEMIFMKSGYIGDSSSFSYNGAEKSVEDYISNIFNRDKWTHMPIISSQFMKTLCSKINDKDIEKYNLQFVLSQASIKQFSWSSDSAENDEVDRQKISSYGSIVINIKEKEEETQKEKIEALNKLKLSYYKALWENKFDSNKSKDFFEQISFISANNVKIDFVNRINQCTNLDNLKNNNKETLNQLVPLLTEIIGSEKLTAQDKSSLLQDLFKGASEVNENTRWSMVSRAIDGLSNLISTSSNDDAFFLSNVLKSTCESAVSIKSKAAKAYKIISQVLGSVGCLINTDAFDYLFTQLRGDTTKDLTNNCLDAINSVAKKLASDEEINYATKKLEKLLDLVKYKEEKDENENSQDQDQKENTSNKKEESKSQKNVEIVNKNINSDIFQSLFEVINKCYPLLNDKNEFNLNNFNKRNELRNTLFDSFLKVDKKLKGAMSACNSIVKKIMDDSSLSKIKDGNAVRSELEFLIRITVDGRKKFSASSNKSIVDLNDIRQLINTIKKYFPQSAEEENADNNRYGLIKYLLESLKEQNIDSDVFQLLFSVIDEEFPLPSDDENTTVSPGAEELKKRNELLGKLSEISVIADSEKNQAAQEQYFDTVNKMMESYKSKFLGTNKIAIEDQDKNGNEKKKLTLESLIRMTILGQVKLSPNPTQSKVKYKNIVELVDIIEKSFQSDSEDDKNNRYDLIKCLFEQFSIVKDFLLPCDKMQDGIMAFAKNNKVEAGKQLGKAVVNIFTRKKQILDFFTPAKESAEEPAEKTEETKDKISEITSMQEKPENTPKKEKNKKAGNKILSYKEILPTGMITAVNDYNNKLKKDQLDKKFDLDTQVLDDIKKHNVMKKISELNKIINSNSLELENPVIGIFKFLSDKKFNLDRFLSDFQSNYLDTVVNLINLGSKMLDQFITKQDVTKETGELFKPEAKSRVGTSNTTTMNEDEGTDVILEDKDKTKNGNGSDQFNQNLVYNSKLKHINELIISNLIQQGIKKVVENLNKFFVKSFKDEKDENKDLINKEHQCNIPQNKIDEVSKKITDLLLKKFSSVYGLVSEIQKVAQNAGKNGEYNTTASAIFDFVLDCINDENNKDSNLLLLLLELVGEFSFGNLNIEKDSVQSKKIVYNIINSFMGLIAFSKALDCDTEIFANDKNINNKKKTTDKLINLLKKMVATEKFKSFVGKFLSDEYIEKIKQLLNDVDKLKFEDCAYLLCSDEILAQNKENKKENEKSEEKKNQNAINIINEGDDENKFLDDKNFINSIKEENKIESKLDIILNQTAMFSWLRLHKDKDKKDQITFFDLTKSLSDNDSIKKFEKYQKEQIKNGQKTQNKMINSQINNDTNSKLKVCTQASGNNKINNKNKISTENSITKKSEDQIVISNVKNEFVAEKKNNLEIQDKINNNDNDTNKINIDPDIKQKEIENKNDTESNNTIQLKNASKITDNHVQMSVNTNNNHELKPEKQGNIKNENGNNIENNQDTKKIDIKNKDITDDKENNNQNEEAKQTEKQEKKQINEDKTKMNKNNDNKSINEKNMSEQVINKNNENQFDHEDEKEINNANNSNKNENEIEKNDIKFENNKESNTIKEKDKLLDENTEKNTENEINNQNQYVGEENIYTSKQNMINNKGGEVDFNIEAGEIPIPIRNNTSENNENKKKINSKESIISNTNPKQNITGIFAKNSGFEARQRSNSFSLKNDKKPFGSENKNSFNNTNQIRTENEVNKDIPPEKSKQKNKIITAFVFGIISVLSCVTLVVALLEALKLLAIIAASVLAVTFTITIVLIFFIFKDNKVSELNNVQKDLEQIGEMNINQHDKNTEIKRCKSYDDLRSYNLNGSEAKEDTLINKNK